jgi:hypothetical protein
MKSLSQTLNSTMKDKCVTNIELLETNFSFFLFFNVGDKLFIHRTIQCWWQTFHSSYYSVLVTNFSFIVPFSVGDKLFIHRTIQCWWHTFHSSYYSVLVTNFSKHWMVRWMKSLSLTLNSTMNEKFVTNTE